jgi:hypothetical protein
MHWENFSDSNCVECADEPEPDEPDPAEPGPEVPDEPDGAWLVLVVVLAVLAAPGFFDPPAQAVASSMTIENSPAKARPAPR